MVKQQVQEQKTFEQPYKIAPFKKVLKAGLFNLTVLHGMNMSFKKDFENREILFIFAFSERQPPSLPEPKLPSPQTYHVIFSPRCFSTVLLNRIRSSLQPVRENPHMKTIRDELGFKIGSVKLQGYPVHNCAFEIGKKNQHRA